MRTCIYCKKSKNNNEFIKKDKGACKSCANLMDIMLTADDEDTEYLNSMGELIDDD